MGITVLDSAGVNQAPELFHNLHNVLVSILYLLAEKVFHWLGESALVINRADHFLILADNACCQANAVIVLAEIRSLMNDSSSTFICYIRIGNNAKRSFYFELNKK